MELLTKQNLVGRSEQMGRLLAIELYGCDTRIIRNTRAVQQIMMRAAKAMKANIVDVVFHNFAPNGVSGVVVIAESHLAIHTWPEYQYASIDVYTCGHAINPWKAYEYLRNQFKANDSSVQEIGRGLPHNYSTGTRHPILTTSEINSNQRA